MHGLGNDFVVPVVFASRYCSALSNFVSWRIEILVLAAIRSCSLKSQPATGVDFRYRIFNADVRRVLNSAVMVRGALFALY